MNQSGIVTLNKGEVIHGRTETLVSKSAGLALRHADLFGLRAEKYGELQSRRVGDTDWHFLTPDSALMLWRRFDATNSDEYQSHVVINDIFSSSGGDGRGSSWAKGLATTKDHLFISFDRKDALEKIGLLASTTVFDAHVGDVLSIVDTPYSITPELLPLK